MGQLKDEAIKNETEDIQQHKLTDAEMNYVRLLNIALQYHTLGQKILSGFLYYVCTTRLGYKDGVNLQFELDFDKQDNLLTIKLLPDTITAPPAAPPTPAAE
jgi:hypothetical protein